MFNTLRAITEDLLKIVRGSKIAESEVISRRQIGDWVNQYRALLISRDLEKGYNPNPDYNQNVGPISLIQDGDEKVTDVEVPTSIDMNYQSGFSFVGDANGCEIQMIPEHRKCWQQYKRYTLNDPLWYLGTDGKIHVINGEGIDSINVEGIFEDPIAADRASGKATGLDSRYPIPNNILPTLKEMILKKELGIESNAPSDNKNDDEHGVERQTENQFRG